MIQISTKAKFFGGIFINMLNGKYVDMISIQYIVNF